ncbi:phenylacetate-CoA oxygenase subunit PaaJ [Paraneptunicella aestuarii]|uniref:1,2-phenylacetyl-CoA epoxidase subunit PaaD n=1 Tax=Paraneptunicella aestuarii TaxID=2831148 RepID=UPI001E42A527|nr:1,2-phenylacetyl-CoA epoxidase subunit PaaD [Paraneptunicella aestuarii]UAA37440.1 phenylacetate-CoA oxygenase subunit PaaJ [Paraneptunicella aestuarii]
MQQIPTITPEKRAKQARRHNSSCPELWDLLDEVKDPEIPVLSLWDIGILKDIEKSESGVCVTITPTYSGCPAMDEIKEDIVAQLNQHGYEQVQVKTVLSPSWTTDDMTDEGQDALRAYGIAPPKDAPQGCIKKQTPMANVKCPHCGSTNTVRISEFGSTSCKSLFKCNDCHEPFDFFKNI